MTTARTAQNPDVVITHPNRDTAAAKTTRSFVILVLAASCVLTFVLLFGAWGHQLGAQGLQFVTGILFGYFAFGVARWRSGVLPIAAGVAIVTGVFAAVSVSGWFDRDGLGYEATPIPQDLLGVLLIAFAILQMVVVVLTLRGFTQQWQVELEVPRNELRGHAA
ncbi:MAG: hypothetical protein PGN13_01740 [Patulibacter minatonensis]